MTTYGRCLTYLTILVTSSTTSQLGVTQRKNTMSNNNQDSLEHELSESLNQVEDSICGTHGEGLSSPRVVTLHNDDELDYFEKELMIHLISNDGKMDETTESWLDSEFNRIYVAYAYADVTKVN